VTAAHLFWLSLVSILSGAALVVLGKGDGAAIGVGITLVGAGTTALGKSFIDTDKRRKETAQQLKRTQEDLEQTQTLILRQRKDR
jgi:hypothetical protein